MTATIVRPWAKLATDAAGAVSALPLADHGFDVAAAFEALVRGGAWDNGLVQTAGRALTDQDVTRLTVLAALHDIGKANAGFQARSNPNAFKVGHEGEVAALLLDATLKQSAAGVALHQIRQEWGAAPFFPALWAHHGRLRTEFGGSLPTGGQNRAWEKHAQYWKPVNGYDPATEAGRIIATVRARWPRAWDLGDKLPHTPRFVALFAGLLVLADWIGSDTKRFPVDGPHGDTREALRIVAAGEAIITRGLAPVTTPPGDFAAAFEGFEPRGIQTVAAADDLGPVALIEAETGSGKTEAALWRWLDLRRRGAVHGLFFALPTRTAAVQLHARVDTMLRRVWGDAGPRAVLAVPGYLRAGDVDGQALPGYEVRWEDEGTDDSRWAAERSNRYLAARVAVGTIDQALLGGLRVRHAPVRAAALARSLLVVDEVHASDAYMGRLLEHLLDNHVEAGGHALLLSATLGAEARARLLGGGTPSLAEAVAQPYPALAGRGTPPRGVPLTVTSQKRVTIEVAGDIDDADAIAARAAAAARAGASVLVVRNSVRRAVAVAQAIGALAPDLAFRVNGVTTLHHGRFAPEDRRLLDDAVEAAFGKGRSAAGRVLVGTQTLEQSLDIDADLLITDLAPMDVLLQRIGRLHRHADRERGAFAEARVVVLRFGTRDLTPLLGPVRDRHGMGPTKYGSAYPDLLQLEATLRLLETNARIAIPADNRRLVEHALHPEVIDALTNELGTAWANHAANRASGTYADESTADVLSLNLATPFRDLDFPSGTKEKAITTRLGARDLLVDLEPAITGPFGEPVKRIAIPARMAGNVTFKDELVPLGHDEDGWRFSLGTRTFVYDRWGLSRLT